MNSYDQVKKINARDQKLTSREFLENIFNDVLDEGMVCDSRFADVRESCVLGVAGLPFSAPILSLLLGEAVIRDYCLEYIKQGVSVLFIYRKNRVDQNGIMELYLGTKEKYWKEEIYQVKIDNEEIPQKEIGQKAISHKAGYYKEIQLKEVLDEGNQPKKPGSICQIVKNFIEQVSSWPGEINKYGEHYFDPRVISPGPHYFVNLLLGNRMGYPRPLQTVPKSVVDGLGRGSFRSHAGTQVLATRWDLRPEENGFPLNRQFYLLEDNKQLFYSANPYDPEIIKVETCHGVDNTIIRYKLRSGLRVEREIFLLPQMPDQPLAVEVQRIRVKNLHSTKRKIKLIAVGMFGCARASELSVDVIYTTLISETSLLQDGEKGIIAIGVNYQPPDLQEDFRFFSMLIRDGHGHGNRLPKEFSADFNGFIGRGTIERPEGLRLLDNNYTRRGPDFFALAGEIELISNGETIVDCFTGLVSAKGNPDFAGWESYQQEILNLLRANGDPVVLDQIIKEKGNFMERFRSFLQIESGDFLADGHFNHNLPFQIFYQTFVSRSFAWTQKGYREIGFREIQDIFASMYFFISMNEGYFVKSLIKEWGSMIFDLGYAYHNFFWKGKEPGRWSDDALWFVQAVDRYLKLTNDYEFLNERVSIAGTEPIKERSIYETLQAVIRYSGRISIGKHGLPLLDYADWNDCLKLDPHHIDGLEKEKLYLKQLENSGGTFGETPFQSDFTESVMNGFLLKVALDALYGMAEVREDKDYLKKLAAWRKELVENLQKHAWKGDFFARALFNRSLPGGYEYLGAGKDGLSLDPAIHGTYFLNSFSWSVLSEVATEDQIAIMLDVISRHLKTPYGLKLCSPVAYGKISSNVPSAQYFPGDRENGGVFKHACMMAVAAFLKAASEVSDMELAEKLWRLAYEMIDLVRPYHSLKNPYKLCGNPRFCTQYNNSETGENMGPILSGTASWFWLSMVSALGVSFTGNGLSLNPMLAEKQTKVILDIQTGDTRYKIEITKPIGFWRLLDQPVEILLDGQVWGKREIPLFKDGMLHQVEVRFKKREK